MWSCGSLCAAPHASSGRIREFEERGRPVEGIVPPGCQSLWAWQAESAPANQKPKCSLCDAPGPAAD